jgi:hypothetical protein
VRVSQICDPFCSTNPLFVLYRYFPYLTTAAPTRPPARHFKGVLSICSTVVPTRRSSSFLSYSSCPIYFCFHPAPFPLQPPPTPLLFFFVAFSVLVRLQSNAKTAGPAGQGFLMANEVDIDRVHYIFQQRSTTTQTDKYRNRKHTSTHTHTHTHTHTYTHTQTRTIHTHTHTHRHTQIHTNTHRYTHKQTHTNTRRQKHTHTHTYTHTHTHTYTHTHTHTHGNTLVYNLKHSHLSSM